MIDLASKIKITYHRDRLITIKREFLDGREGKPPYTPEGIVSFACSSIDKVIGREGRNTFLSWLCDREVSTHKKDSDDGLTEWDYFKLCMWARPAKVGKWQLTSEFWELDSYILSCVLPIKEKISLDKESEEMALFFLKDDTL